MSHDGTLVSLKRLNCLFLNMKSLINNYCRNPTLAGPLDAPSVTRTLRHSANTSRRFMGPTFTPANDTRVTTTETQISPPSEIPSLKMATPALSPKENLGTR